MIAVTLVPAVFVTMIVVGAIVTGEWRVFQRYWIFLLALSALAVLWARPVLFLVHTVDVEPRKIVFHRLFAASVVVPAGSVHRISRSKRNPMAFLVQHDSGSLLVPSRSRASAEVLRIIRAQNTTADMSISELLQQGA